MHRDLKPQNILVSKLKQVKIIDFNVSRRFDGAHPKLMTQTGDPRYRAPEIFEQTYYNELVDIWSTGLIFFHLASGRLLFSDENLPSLIEGIQTRDLHSPIQSLARISEPGKHLLSQMLVRDPEERWSAAHCLQHEWFHGIEVPRFTSPAKKEPTPI